MTNLVSEEMLGRLHKGKGFRNIRHFTDDGYTGTNFNRPGFNALLDEIIAPKKADINRFMLL